MFSKLIKKALIDKNMRQTELAERLGLGSNNVSQRLARDTFTEKEMRKWADAVGMEIVIELKDKN